MPKDVGWRPDYERLSDIMQPYEASDDAQQPEDSAQKVTVGTRDWRAKVAAEDRQRHRSQARSRRRIWPGIFLRREAEPDRRDAKRGVAIARTDQPRVAAQIAPYAVILLLAPFIGGPGGFYLLVLLLAAPATAAALLLRPLGQRAWLLGALIPLLPVEAHFALRYLSWDPGTALLMMSLFALAGTLYYIFAVHGKGPGKVAPKLETRNAQLELEVRARRRVRRARGDDVKQAAKERKRRLLLFAVPLMCTALLLPALLGLGMQLRRPVPNVPTELEAQMRGDDAFMARRMNGAYEHLQSEAWGQMDRGEKLAALQALLDVETDRQEIRRFDLRDPAVLAAAGGRGHTGVSAALLSGDSKAELRVRAMCHLAYHLMQLTVSGDINMLRFEDEAKAYEDARYNAYVNTWNNREAEIDHAG